jgi:DNA-binding transcriptional ArsR family regulator
VGVRAFDILGDPVRRRILELLAEGELAAGDVGAVVQAEFGISQPAVSQHLKVLRDNGFARVRAEGTRRLYAVEPEPLREADVWLDHFRRFWTPHLDALATELARGRRERRLRAERDAATRATAAAGPRAGQADGGSRGHSPDSGNELAGTDGGIPP